MPGLMGRISALVRAKISKLPDRTEDPAETLDYAYEHQLENHQKLGLEVARALDGLVAAVRAEALALRRA
jgi:phage shock protein A